MKSSNQCIFVSKLFLRLLGTAILILIVGSLLHTRPASAASGNTYTGKYVIENSLRRTVVPLPDGAWHKVHEEIRHDAHPVSTYQSQTIYLVQIDGSDVSGVIRILTNKEFHGGASWNPSNLCYRKKWKYIKQESVLNRNVFCWGVRNIRFGTNPRKDTPWESTVKKIREAGWSAPLGIRGTLARYARSDSDKMLDVSYSFFLTARMPWMATRDWLRDLKPRIQAGFQGKYVTPPKGAAGKLKP